MSRTPLIGVLALQGDVREHESALRACGAATRRVRTVSDLDGLDGLLLPGGESTTISMLAERTGLMPSLQGLASAGLPMYGSCAGMILLADDVLDGRADQTTVGGMDMTVRRNAFGRQVDSFECDLTVPAVGDEPFPGVFIRAPLVERVGAAAEVLARVDSGPDGAGRIVAVRQGPMLATAFHPELTSDLRVHALFVEMVRNR